MAALDGARPLTVNLLAEHEARDLLARRLGAERLNTEPAAATELIALSARLPLALNIVAALAAEPGYPLAALATDLRDERSRMDILQTEDPASSLRAVFSWSYQNLSQPAAWLFRLLSLHPGPDITIAAAASLGGLGLAQTRAVITELADANLISEQTPGRYAFHDLLRSYAAGLAAATETEADRQEAVHRALDHYLQTAYAGSVALSPARLRFLLEPPRPGVVPEPIVDSADAMAWFSAERQVLLAAAKEASELGFDRHGWQLPWAAALFFTRKGYWPDLLDSQHAAIAAARRLGDRTGQAYAWRELGWARFHLGAFNDAIDCFQQALDLHAQLGDRPGQARAHHDIAAAADKLRRFDLALRHAQESLGLCQGGDDQVAVAKALNEVGWLHAQLGQPERALAYCEQALDLVRPLDDPVNEAAILDSIGYALTHLERHTEAIERLRAAARMIEGNRAPPWAVDMLIHLGDACMAGGQRDEGYRAWADALAIMEDLQHPDAARFREEIARFRPESPGATD